MSVIGHIVTFLSLEILSTLPNGRYGAQTNIIFTTTSTCILQYAPFGSLHETTTTTTTSSTCHFPLIFLGSFSAIGTHKHDLRRGWKVSSRITFNVYKHVATIGREPFRRLYRITYLQFETLFRLTKPYLQSSIQRSSIYATIVSTEVKLCVTLRILAGASYLDVRWPYRIGRSTTYLVFWQLLSALNKALPKLSFPEREEECLRSSLLFQQSRNSPNRGIIAALVGHFLVSITL